MSARPLFEVCVDSIDGVRAAAAAGVERVELCSGLVLGGLTPASGLIEWTRENTSLEAFALLRSRGGDFLLDDDELEQLLRDIGHCRKAGAQGIVVGALLADGSVDVDRMRRFLDASAPLPLTFHRAFDLGRDPRRNLDTLLELGVPRLLSSGAAADSISGQALLAELVRIAGSRLVVMPGGGIRPENVAQLVAATGAQEVHFSGSATRDGPMKFRRPEVAMGIPGMPGEYERRSADITTLRRYFEAFSPGPGLGRGP